MDRRIVKEAGVAAQWIERENASGFPAGSSRNIKWGEGDQSACMTEGKSHPMGWRGGQSVESSPTLVVQQKRRNGDRDKQIVRGKDTPAGHA